MSKENFEIPQADDLVGIPSGEENLKPKIVENLEEIFRKFRGGRIEDLEINKSERDIELIDIANKAVSEYLTKYGRGKNLIIPIENIHLLKEGGTEKFTDGIFIGGAHSTLYGSIVIDRMKSDVDCVLRLFHELFHTKSYQAIQLTTAEKPEKRKLDTYRSGFSVTSRDGSITYFKDVEEAVIGYMTKKFYHEVLSKEKSFSEEISRLTSEGKEPDFSRAVEQERGMKLVDEIYKVNRDSFKNKEEIIDLFVEAQVTGKLMKVGRLIEKTFGKGSFRKLGKGELKVEKHELE